MPDDKSGFPATNNIKAFDKDALYSLEIVTDMVAGQIQRLTPVNENGVRDTTRFVRFFSNVTVTHGGRPYTVSFEIPAKSFSEAIAMFVEEGSKAAMAFLEKMESDRLKANLQGMRSSAGPLPKLVLPN